MSEQPPAREPDPTPEDEGIPDLTDGSPEAGWMEDPQEMPLPGDDPQATEDYGVTADEQRTGEPLDQRLRREVDDHQERPPGRPARPAGRIVQEDEGVRHDTQEEAVAEEASDDLAGRSPEERAMRVEPE
jgi:hypothetical protein